MTHTSPGWTYGYTPSDSEWNGAFAVKQDWDAKLDAFISGSITATGTFTLGTGTPEGSANAFQVNWNADPYTGAVDTRKSIFNTTLTYSGTSSHIWENLNSFVTVNGTGVANGEINLAHTYLQINSGANVQVAEGYESSATSAGVVGHFSHYLGLFNNNAGGTVTSIDGFTIYLNNTNTVAGCINVWSGINIGPMTGGGSTPTFYNAIRIPDTKAGIVTLGGVNIGSVGNATPNTLFIKGQDNSPGTFPFVLQNLAGSVFDFDNGGNANFRSAGAAIGPNTGGILSIASPDTNTGHFAVSIKNSAAATLLAINNAGGISAGVSGQLFTFGGGVATAAALTNAANDAAAATAGVAVNQFYRNGSVVMQRIT